MLTDVAYADFTVVDHQVHTAPSIVALFSASSAVGDAGAPVIAFRGFMPCSGTFQDRSFQVFVTIVKQ